MRSISGSDAYGPISPLMFYMQQGIYSLKAGTSLSYASHLYITLSNLLLPCDVHLLPKHLSLEKLVDVGTGNVELSYPTSTIFGEGWAQVSHQACT